MLIAMSRKHSIHIFSFLLLLVFGSYLVPEHYLKHLHPHEHTSCSGHCSQETETLTGLENRCDDEKDYFFSPLPKPLVFEASFSPVAKVVKPELPETPSRTFFPIPPRSPPSSL